MCKNVNIFDKYQQLNIWYYVMVFRVTRPHLSYFYLYSYSHNLRLLTVLFLFCLHKTVATEVRIVGCSIN